ncbi:MAG: dihydroorotate dehydrogenase (quinone), partial [Candidatus Saccharibacteria bacterium]|nr:dihydroorotate dehydrogenase (quinone) [Pseudorhodobacter sp.]
RLRDLQGRAALSALLAGVMETNRSMPRPVPIFLKIAPDLTDDDLAEIAETAIASGLSGIIATNTTLDREGLKSASRGEKGGLSGAPLFEKSTRVLARLSKLTAGALPLIGVGGISTPEQAYAKICAGATAVQFYTAMVYEGLSLANRLAQGVDALLANDGHVNVGTAVGSRRGDWL